MRGRLFKRKRPATFRLNEDPMVQNEKIDALPNEEAALAELEMANRADELSRIP